MTAYPLAGSLEDSETAHHLVASLFYLLRATVLQYVTTSRTPVRLDAAIPSLASLEGDVK